MWCGPVSYTHLDVYKRQVQWVLAHPEASKEEILEACIERIKGPDFPNGALIVGRKGIEDAYRTGRGSVIMLSLIHI